MSQISPVSDLQNNFAEISRIVHEVGEPVFLIKNGYGDMVVLSIEQYEEHRQERQIDAALKEAQNEARESPTRYDFEEVSSKIRKKLVAKLEEIDV